METWILTGDLKGLQSTEHVVRKFQASRMNDLELQFNQGAIKISTLLWEIGFSSSV